MQRCRFGWVEMARGTGVGPAAGRAPDGSPTGLDEVARRTAESGAFLEWFGPWSYAEAAERAAILRLGPDGVVTIGDWLDQHGVPRTEDGYYVFACPRGAERGGVVRAGSEMRFPGDASPGSTRLLVQPGEIQAGPSPTLRRDVALARPTRVTGIRGPTGEPMVFRVTPGVECFGLRALLPAHQAGERSWARAFARSRNGLHLPAAPRRDLAATIAALLPDIRRAEEAGADALWVPLRSGGPALLVLDPSGIFPLGD